MHVLICSLQKGQIMFPAGATGDSAPGVRRALQARQRRCGYCRAALIEISWPLPHPHPSPIIRVPEALVLSFDRRVVLRAMDSVLAEEYEGSRLQGRVLLDPSSPGGAVVTQPTAQDGRRGGAGGATAHALRAAFLPDGYPDSVSSDYLGEQRAPW